MKESVYNFNLTLDWSLIQMLSTIDRFDASWSSIEKRERKNLKQLKSIATIMSVGASTRIEGSNLSDADVKTLLNKIDITKIEDRSSQEVVGYFNVLDEMSDSYHDISVSERDIKGLHNLMLKISSKDVWHRGDYKQNSNSVQATFADGSRQIIFKTTPPGFATEDAMRALITWYNKNSEVHPVIRVAAFAYEFLSIHPFQDGNGRLSRLLTNLLLLKAGYQWIQYVSFEHEIESNKKAYYRKLRNCQAQRPGEDISEWINFFLKSLLNIQTKLEQKLTTYTVRQNLSPVEREILFYITEHPGTRSGEIKTALELTASPTKKGLKHLLELGLIKKFGAGAGTNYAVS